MWCSGSDRSAGVPDYPWETDPWFHRLPLLSHEESRTEHKHSWCWCFGLSFSYFLKVNGGCGTFFVFPSQIFCHQLFPIPPRHGFNWSTRQEVKHFDLYLVVELYVKLSQHSSKELATAALHANILNKALVRVESVMMDSQTSAEWQYFTVANKWNK